MTERKEPSYRRLDTEFISRGECCAAWLYLPEGVIRPPVVVMAHGLGGDRRFRLDAFARRFAERGLACFVFDYRGFWESAGEPRNLISPRRHLEDWQAALDHVKSLDSIDPGKIGLWGTSFSGGHVLVTAARRGDVRAIVMQVPFVDGLSSGLNYPLSYILRAFLHGLGDLLAMVFTLGKARHRVLYAGGPEEFALLNKPDCLPGIKNLIPEELDWEELNYRCPASIFITLPLYRPVRYAAGVSCPALVIYSESDSLIPAEGVRKTAGRMRDARLEPLPPGVGHFDPYHGEEFERMSGREADFLCRVLQGP